MAWPVQRCPVTVTRAERGAAATVAVGWGVILAAVLAVGWLLTHSLEPSIGVWDDDAARWFAAERTGDLGRIADVGRLLGDTWVGIGLALAVAVAVSLWQHSLRPAIFVVVLMAGNFGFYLVATQLITRDRPPVPILDPGLVPDHSFPSGHVATAVAVYGGTALLVGYLRPRTRPWIWALLVIPVLVAVARLYQGAHHPTDVLTSLLAMTAWLTVVARVLLTGTAARAPG